MARAAQLGEEGDVDGALAVTKQADNLGKQHEALFKQLTEPERTMTVCDICGVFINSTDNDQRRLVSRACGGCCLASLLAPCAWCVVGGGELLPGGSCIG